MPRSAIATGMVDWVLPVAEMGRRVARYVASGSHLRLPEVGPEGSAPSGSPQGPGEQELRDVLNLLRARTGRDFARYKRATIIRRIARRMQVNEVQDFGDYVSCLRTRPGEAEALLQDLLISVTNFFRDAECFAALEREIPALFEGKAANGALRAWVVACATGEEAYSVAMLLAEHAARLPAAPTVQVFATDLDEQAIRVAREGVYPLSIAADVSDERLRRLFTKEHRGYRVRRELREQVLFAAHDALRDAPFSRLDLVSCRNLLIYLDRDAQRRLLETVHFALLPTGRLFLGASETVDDDSALLLTLDKKNRIYAPRPLPRANVGGPGGRYALAHVLELHESARTSPVLPGPAFLGAIEPRGSSQALMDSDGRPLSWTELHFRMLELLAPPSIVVDAQHDIVHLSPHAGRFLQFAGGEPSRNLLRAMHSSLRIELRGALFQAEQRQSRVDVAALPVTMDGQALSVRMSVLPMADLSPGFLLVTLDAVREGAPATPIPVVGSDNEPLTQLLDRELERLKSHLRDTVEQYEASTEELKASNEELQGMNEELRPATEELETSREELQSINEELTTVNQELKAKVDELGHANSDIQNLMDATAIATVFLDRGLRITRYTPSAVELFNLIPSDLGRPLSDLGNRVNYPEMEADATCVLQGLVPITREVAHAHGNSFLVGVLPYRVGEDRIAGVVLTLVDITERKPHQEALRLSEQRFDAVADKAAVGPLELSEGGVVTYATTAVRPVHAARAVDAMRALLDDLQDVSRLRFGRLALNKHEVSLRAVVDSALETARALIERRGHTLGVSLPDEPVRLVVDPTRMAQVLSNLLINAAKYTDEGGRIELRAFVQDDQCRIEVADNGKGLDEAARRSMFEMFWRQRARHRQRAGHGHRPGRRAQRGADARRQHHRGEREPRPGHDGRHHVAVGRAGGPGGAGRGRHVDSVRAAPRGAAAARGGGPRALVEGGLRCPPGQAGVRRGALRAHRRVEPLSVAALSRPGRPRRRRAAAVSRAPCVPRRTPAVHRGARRRGRSAVDRRGRGRRGASFPVRAAGRSWRPPAKASHGLGAARRAPVDGVRGRRCPIDIHG